MNKIVENANEKLITMQKACRTFFTPLNVVKKAMLMFWSADTEILRI